MTIGSAGQNTVRIENKIQSLDVYYETKKSKYLVAIRTKSKWFTWFGDNTVNITVFGDKAKTSNNYLANAKPVVGNAVLEYEFIDQDVGEIEFITFENRETKEEIKWYLEHVHIQKDDEKAVEFPVFQWISNRTSDPLIIMTNKTVLPQNESKVREKARSIQQEIVQNNFQWSHEVAGFPGSSGFLPPVHDVFTTPEIKTEGSPDLESFFSYPVETITNTFSSSNSSNESLTINYPKEKTLEIEWVNNWLSDEEFGRQALNGSLPVLIKRIKCLPKNFPVNSEIVSNFLERGMSFNKEMDCGYIYLQDFSMLEDIEGAVVNGKKLDVASPLVLYYLKPNDKLVPIAIQLGQKPGEQFPIWTPKDTPEDWLNAKMWVRNSESQASQLYFHLTYCHFGMEPFVMAMYRCLNDTHPIYKLLKENFQNIMEVNAGGRNAVLNAPLDLVFQSGNNGAQKLVGKRVSSLNFEDLDYMKDLERRDIDDLPNFHHRDDARKIWNVSSEYVSQVIDFFYPCDQSVEFDTELQNMAEELSKEGFGKIKTDTPYIGLPTKFETKDQLKDFVIKLFFTTTGLHSSFNFFEYHRFMPACPYQIHSSLPREENRGTTTYKTIFDNIPSREKLGPDLSGAFDFVTSAFTPQQTWIKETPRWTFVESPVKAIHDKFVENLKKVEVEIDERNRGLTIPYMALKPSRIPAGIAI